MNTTMLLPGNFSVLKPRAENPRGAGLHIHCDSFFGQLCFLPCGALRCHLCNGNFGQGDEERRESKKLTLLHAPHSNWGQGMQQLESSKIFSASLACQNYVFLLRKKEGKGQSLGTAPCQVTSRKCGVPAAATLSWAQQGAPSSLSWRCHRAVMVIGEPQPTTMEGGKAM